MDLRAQRLEAIVLRSIAYGESDAVVHLLVRGRGRISAFGRSSSALWRAPGSHLNCRPARAAAAKWCPDGRRSTPMPEGSCVPGVHLVHIRWPCPTPLAPP